MQDGFEKVEKWAMARQMGISEAWKGRAGPPAHEKVYRDLRDRLLFGDLVPGQAVTIQGLTQSLEAGMTPVREALRRLTAEGALAFQGNRRISVPVLDRANLEQLAFARAVLEPELAARACPRTTAADLATLSRIDAQLDRAIVEGDTQAYLRLNHHFHTSLYALADAPVLSGMAEGLWLRFGPSLRSVLFKLTPKHTPDMHKALLLALTQGDRQAAALAIREDLEQGMQHIRDALPRDSNSD